VTTSLPARIVRAAARGLDHPGLETATNGLLNLLIRVRHRIDQDEVL